jgi:hypothetical protein
MKASIFYVDSLTNKLFGFYEEQYSIIEVDIPFKVGASLFFYNSAVKPYKEIIDQCRSIVIAPEYSDRVFPGYMFYSIKKGDTPTEYIKILEDEKEFMIPDYIRTINGFKMQMNESRVVGVFNDMHKNELIDGVLSNKVSAGTRLVSLDVGDGRKPYAFYAFKSLIGPYNKADTLDIIIRDNPWDRNKFILDFSVNKKRSKLNIEGLSSFKIITHSSMINLI